VQLYGGFAGTETERDQRNWIAHEAVIDGSTALAGEAAYHVVLGANSATLDGFTVSGGRARTSGLSSTTKEGGGMFNGLVAPTLVNCMFRDNAAESAGGAISNRSVAGSIIITDCTFTGNWVANTGAPDSYAYGGAIANTETTAVISGCTFADNATQSTAYWPGTAQNRTSRAAGGALYNYNCPSVTLSECLIDSNLAYAIGEGAGEISGNMYAAQPQALGAGIYARFSSLRVDRCILRSNQAQTNNNAPYTTAQGAGVYAEQSILTMTNTAVLGNTGTDYGAGLRTAGAAMMSCASATLTNMTFVNNVSDSDNGDHGGGLYSENCAPAVTNCILWGNSGVDLQSIYGDPVVMYCDIEKRAITGLGNFSQDPKFMNLGAGDLRLQGVSPCVDAGRDTSSAAFGSVTLDLPGNARGYDGAPGYDVDGSDYDIGAYEYVGR